MNLELVSLSVVQRDGSEAVRGVSVTLAAGESTALVGANGAGKTSLLYALVGLLRSSGTIRAGGLELNRENLTEIRRRIGFVFQNPDDQLFMPNLYDDIAFAPRNLGLDEDTVEVRVRKLAEQLDIEPLLSRSPLRISGGEKRSAQIATALASDPDILLLDEPTAFLDPRGRRRLAALIKELPQTKLIATHDLSFARDVCCRVIVLHEGRLACDGDASLLADERALEQWGL